MLEKARAGDVACRCSTWEVLGRLVSWAAMAKILRFHDGVIMNVVLATTAAGEQ